MKFGDDFFKKVEKKTNVDKNTILSLDVYKRQPLYLLVAILYHFMQQQIILMLQVVI